MVLRAYLGHHAKVSPSSPCSDHPEPVGLVRAPASTDAPERTQARLGSSCPLEKHEPRGVGRSSASVYMSKQVVAVTNWFINYLGHGHDQGKSELGGWDEVVAVTGGSGYKWEQLWYCSLITLIMGVIKACPEIVGGLNPSGNKGGGQFARGRDAWEGHPSGDNLSIQGDQREYPRGISRVGAFDEGIEQFGGGMFVTPLKARPEWTGLGSAVGKLHAERKEVSKRGLRHGAKRRLGAGLGATHEQYRGVTRSCLSARRMGAEHGHARGMRARRSA
ncbi:hypothetical protein Syun_020424 [Stephania yunnanensis]|uniref:Uncharacterized protein n=1 Tax=Stephania yunnanensis TaxID=152371 RepID=A0AAP0IFN8_9MAGN